MASEGRNAGPSDQPAVEVRPEMTSQQSQTFKSYGQDYQFAETWANPPPEFVVSTGVANNDQNPGLLEEAHHNSGGNGGAANLASIGGSFKTKESQHTADEQPEVIWVPPSDKPWYKKIAKLWWMIGGISTLGIIAVILAILGALGMLDSHHNKSVVLHTNDPYPSGTSTSLTSTSTPPESTASATSSIEPSSLSTGTSTLPTASPTSTVSSASPYHSLVTKGSQLTELSIEPSQAMHRRQHLHRTPRLDGHRGRRLRGHLRRSQFQQGVLQPLFQR